MFATSSMRRRQLQLLLLFGDALLLSFSMWLISSLRFYTWPETKPFTELFSDSNYWIILFIIFFSQYLL